MKYVQGFFMSLGMFSAIPCPYRPWDEKARHLMLAFLPVVGLIIGMLWYGIYCLMDKIGIPTPLQAAVLMLYPYIITGFIHLDGFMDTADALLSRRPLEEKLRILKDPHTGAFAVISVAVLFTICFAAMQSVMGQINLMGPLGVEDGAPMLCLVFIPVITRCCSAIAMLKGKPLAHSQYNDEAGSKKATPEAIAVGLMGFISIVFVVLLGYGAFFQEANFNIIFIIASSIIAYIIAMLGAVKQLEGVSGDLAGYSLTIAEAVAIIMLALLV